MCRHRNPTAGPQEAVTAGESAPYFNRVDKLIKSLGS